jgi:ariadne-1
MALQNDEVARRANFTCDICYDLYHVDEAITLDCDHRFCKNCLGEYLKEKITSAEVSSDKLICPSCPTPISIHTIQYCVDEDTFSKYNDFAIRQIDFAKTKEVLK